MLAHLRTRVTEILATTESATLATSGPAGIQARVFPCEAKGTHLFLLIPGTSDQLLNLEHDPAAVAVTENWQLHGTARVWSPPEAPTDVSLMTAPAAAGCVLVEILPQRLQINRVEGWGFRETIDIEE